MSSAQTRKNGRLTLATIVTQTSFGIRLLTNKTDPSDTNWDDNALFRIDQGFRAIGTHAYLPDVMCGIWAGVRPADGMHRTKESEPTCWEEK